MVADVASRALVWLAVASAATGCAPSFAGLLRDRHYPEAEAAVRYQRDPAAARARLDAQLAADLAPAVHVHAITADELRALGPGVTLPAHRNGASALVLARVRVETTEVPGGATLGVAIALRDGTKLHGARVVATWEDMVAVFGEQIAQPTTRPISAADSVHNFVVGVQSVAVAATDFVALLANLSTLGLACAVGSLCGSHGPAGHIIEPTVVPPTAAEYARAAPRATVLAAAVEQLRRARGTHRANDWLVALARPADEATAPLVLELTPSLAGQATSAPIRVPLPAGATLEARIAAAFGARMRTLNELRDAR